MVGGHSKRTKCAFPGSNELFYHKSKMIDHLNIYHQVLNFPNEKKFMEWKEKEELRNFVYYSKQRGDRESEMIIHKYFFYQHDVHAKAHRKAAEPARKTSRKFRRDQVKSDRFVRQ